MPTDLKPSTAPDASALAGPERIPCTQGGASKALTPAQIKTYLGDPTGGSTGAVDNAALRADGAGGATAQGSLLIIADDGAVSGATRLDVDNVRLDGNTLSATNANGSVLIAPNGTGNTLLASGALQFSGTTAAFPLLKAAGGGLQCKTADDAASAPFDCSDLTVNGTTTARLVQIQNGFQVTFSDGADRGRGIGAVSGGAGVRITDGSTGIGFVSASREIEASTAGSGAPNLLQATESRKLLTNEGATAEAYHVLPSAASGMEFQFLCQDGDGIRIVANAGDTIRIEAATSAAAGFIRSAVVGSGITLVAINATEWVAVNKPAGTWTVDI